MQALWAEQNTRRMAGAAQSLRYGGAALPVGPSPTALFAGYPTELVEFGAARLIANDAATRPSVADVLTARNYQGLKRIFATPEAIAAVLAAIARAGDAGCGLAEIEAASGIKPALSERIVIWLLKYDFIGYAP